jgi:hypothetical protein
VLLLHFRTAWNDHFPEANPTNTYYLQTFTSRQTPSDTSVYVSNCLFRSITSSSHGGALYSTSVTLLLIESSSFSSCKTSSSYGAICFSNSNSGQCVLHKVCGYDCRSTNGNSYQFAYICVKGVASSKNYANYSSITRCVNEISESWHIFGLQYGKTFCLSVNISLNKCYYHSGISCWPTSDSNYFTSSLTYSSFTETHAVVSSCFRLNSGGAKCEIKSCNILRNTQGNLGTYGTIYSGEKLTIYDSCILENRANCIFYQASSSYTITLSNCTVDSTSNNGYLTTQNTVTKSFILALNHLSTQKCHSEYDSAGYLTPIIQNYSTTKQRLCYTHMKCFNQPPQTNIVSLISVFIFNFINPGAFSYH